MARPKREDPMLVRTPPTLHAVVDAMGTYGTTTAEICGTLLVRRGWVDAHVKPYVHHLYVMPYWAQIIAQQLDRDGMRGGGLYYHAGEIDGIIQGARVLRRSRVIDPANYMPERARIRLENAEAELAELAVSGSATEGEVRAAIRHAKRALAEAQEQVEADLAPAIIAAHKDAVHHRGWFDWREYGDMAPSSLAEIADRGATTATVMAGWGGTAEEAAREIWQKGMVRVEITMPDGTVRAMVMPDPCPEPVRDPTTSIAVPAELLPTEYWRRYITR